MTPEERKQQEEKIQAVVTMFADHMMRKLTAKLNQDVTGWDDPLCMAGIQQELFESAQDVLTSKDNSEVDAANYAMFSWYHKRFNPKQAEKGEDPMYFYNLKKGKGE